MDWEGNKMSVRVSFIKNYSKNKKLLVVLLDDSLKLYGDILSIDKKSKGIISRAIRNKSFAGKNKETLSFLTLNITNVVEVILYGIGSSANLDEDKIERIGGNLFSIIPDKIKNMAITLKSFKSLNVSDVDFAIHLAQGFCLRSYSFNKYKSKSKPKFVSDLQSLEVIVDNPNVVKNKYVELNALKDGVFLTRNLVSEPPNILNPITLSKEVLKLRNEGIEVQVLNLTQIKKLKMGALIGVAQGSNNEPRLVTMRWRANKKSKSKPDICFVGKGVTFDTGGISIKQSNGMEDMKYDMAGAGVVIGLMKALAKRKAKVDVCAVVGLVENMPSGKAQRPSDVVTSFSGHTIEVINTDAEGRLVLADAVSYGIKKFNPKKLIDLATLTGAVIVTLGNKRAGLFSNDDDLANNISYAGEKTGEKLWRLPVGPEYDEDIKSEIADMKNVGSGRGAGSTAGAKFIQQFVSDIPWAHIDIAGVTWSKSNSDLFPSGATAFGVRMLNSYVKKFLEKTKK